ncbi:MAG: site-specific integrase [Thermoanaerobaculia bacterium]|nr:site-specific integrase [Thermoanaerobaculia bacterium]
MASIRRRPTKSGKVHWEAQVRRQGYPPQSRQFARKDDAERWARELERKILLGEARPAPVLLLPQLIDEYEASPAFVLLRPSTRATVHDRLEFWRKKLRAFNTSTLSSEILARMRDEMLREGRKPSTVNRALSVLSAVYRKVARPYYGIKNPLDGVDALPESRGRDRFLFDPEYHQLEEACRESSNRWLVLLFHAALSCGARTSELLAMEKTALDLERGVAYLRAESTKTNQARVLQFHGVGLEALRTACAGSPSRRWVWGFEGDPIFPRGAFENAVKRAGLSDVVWYTLRHTSATWKAMVGCSGPEIAMHLGHNSLHMTRRYVHLAQVYRSEVAPQFVKRLLTG